MESESKLPFYQKSAHILVTAGLSILALYLGKVVILPLIFALFIAILLNPIVNFLIRKKFPHVIAIFTGLLIALVTIGTFILFMSVQISMFSKTYPQLKEKYKIINAEATTWAAKKLNMPESQVTDRVNGFESNSLKSLTNGMGETLSTVSSVLVGIVLVPVYIFLILFYKTLLIEFIRKLFRPQHHAAVAEVLLSVKTIIQSYLVGLLIEGAIVATLNSIGLLVLGVEYAIVLGITGAILNVIPYIGGILAIALPMIIALVTKSWVSALLVLLVYMIIQFIDNHYLIPYIVASKVKLNALFAIIVVIIGDLLWGVPGMFLAIPLTALVKVICDHIEGLKPWGFLLGDNIPSSIRLPFSKIKN